MGERCGSRVLSWITMKVKRILSLTRKTREAAVDKQVTKSADFSSSRTVDLSQGRSGAKMVSRQNSLAKMSDFIPKETSKCMMLVLRVEEEAQSTSNQSRSCIT